jgi:hypothetical protein
MKMLWAILLLLCLLVVIAGVLRLGWLCGRRRLRLHGEQANEGLGALDAAVFGMMGLLLAFTFTGAASRFDERRSLVTAEVNALGTSWLRLDMLPEPARAELRDLFRLYLDGRIAAYQNPDRVQALAQLTEHTARMQARIWNRLMEAIRDTPSVPPVILLPPVNEAFDLSTTRILATRQHPPPAIYAMLVMMVLVSGFLAGFSQAKAARQSLLHMAGFATTTTLALYLIIDLEYPRMGLVRVDTFDQALVELRAGWDQATQ